MRIAVVEDDPSQLELVGHWLGLAGHEASSFQNADAFLSVMAQKQFEVLILDWNLGEVTGIDVLMQLRQISKIPVLFCTSRGGQEDVVKPLHGGADDYLIKPLRQLELLARIESATRRARKLQATEQAFTLERFLVDYASRTITRDHGAAFDLTTKDFELAALLLRNIGRLLSRSHIHDAVWGRGSSVSSRTLDTHVSRIRNKLGLIPSNGWQLKAVYAHGYRLEQKPFNLLAQRAA
jgi:two-component system, OmpR family, response regulator RegX3